MDKLLVIVIILTSWLPWTKEAAKVLSQGRLNKIQGPCKVRGWYGGHDKHVSVCSTISAEDRPMILLHESQHYLGVEYELYDIDWMKFERLALACAKGHSRKAWVLAVKQASRNPVELHAQLPWLVHGKLCPKLQPYYPWFDLRNP